MKIPELLAPVGSMEHLKIAIFAGASSVYLSSKKFGARSYAENLELEEIKEAVEFAHIYNVKVYVTVNTLIKEEEIEEVVEYLIELYKIGVDGVLVQDIGLVKIINEIIPYLTIHSSTQMNIQNIDGMKWAKKNQIKRVVLPRELNFNEIKELTDFAHKNNMEVEIFVHGALCYSYSGKCLFSSFNGGRSGNRGTCAQPCRQKYEIAIEEKNSLKNTNSHDPHIENPLKDNNSQTFNIENPLKDNNSYYKKKKYASISKNQHVLSLKDLLLYEELEKLQKIGIDSLKIEGRMRNKEYVSIVTNNYRKALNQLKFKNQGKDKKSKNKDKKNKTINKTSFNKNEEYLKAIEDLKLVFNREFTSGNFLNQNSEKIINRENPGDHGLYIGTIKSYSKQSNEISILLDSNLITIPEKGDGLVIRNNNNDNNIKNTENRHHLSKSSNNNKKKDAIHNKTKSSNSSLKNSYGLEISKEPVLKKSKVKDERILIIKKVRENKKIDINIDENSKVFISKKKAILDYTKGLVNNSSKRIINKSVLNLFFRIDKSNKPILKGNVILANGKKISLVVEGKPWEIAKNKPITQEKLKKQLSKIGDLPFYIDTISINYDENLFAPISQINNLRREFFKQLEKSIIDSYLNKKNFKTVENNFKEFEDYDMSEKTHEESNISEKKEYSLAIYINSLENLKNLNKTQNSYNRVYLEVPEKIGYNDVIEVKKDKNQNIIDISYFVNFIKEAIDISKEKNYELIWKWPDIIHENLKKDLVKVLGILNKLNIKINIMVSSLGLASYLKEKFKIKTYGSHFLNIYNNEAVLNLKEYDYLNISPEISKKDIFNLMKEYSKMKNYCLKRNDLNTKISYQIPELEIIVHGNIESLISKTDMIFKKEKIAINKKNRNENELNFYLKDLKNNFYPIKEDISGNKILLNSEDLCLIKYIPNLKNTGIENFAIDGRWCSIDYIETIGSYYKKMISNNLDKIEKEKIITQLELLDKKNFTEGNYIKGLNN